MPSTYSSPTKYVTDDDTTSHTTPDNINVTSAQIRWEGVSGYPQTKHRPAENAFGMYSQTVNGSGSISVPMPPRLSPTSNYDSSRLVFETDEPSTLSIDIVAPDGTTLVSDTPSNRYRRVYTWSNASTDDDDLTVNYSSTSGPFTLSFPYRETVGRYETDGGNSHSTVSNSKSHSFSDGDPDTSFTLTPSFPSVPNKVLEYLCTIEFDDTSDDAWECGFHVNYDNDFPNEFEPDEFDDPDDFEDPDDFNGGIIGNVDMEADASNEPWGGDDHSVTYHIPQSVAGNEVPVIFGVNVGTNEAGSITATAETRYVEQTKNPSVSGDVSGSYNGLLDHGEWTPWQPLSGVTEGTNDFTHNIEQAGEANTEFKYTYEFVGPDAVAVVRVQHDGTVYDLPLADPSDSALENTNLRVNVNNDTLAADLVDPSDPNTTPVRITVPNHGTLAWRKNL